MTFENFSPALGKLKRLAKLSAWLLLFLIVSSFLLSSFLIQQLNQSAEQDEKQLPQGEVIFVLAHIVRRGEVLPLYQTRLNAAYELWKELPRPIWLLAARAYNEPHTNSYEAKQYLLKKGIPETWITIYDDFPFVDESLDTFTEVRNAALLAKIRGVKNLIAISDAIHLAEAKIIFKEEGVAPLFKPSSDPRKTFSFWQNIPYQFIRRATLAVSLFDRKGRLQSWVRQIRKSGTELAWFEY